MKRLMILLCSMALILSVATVASAIPIQGELYWSGISVDSSFNAETATDLPSMTGTAWGTEDLSSLTGIVITTEAFTFNPAATPAANPLWVAGDFSFILDTVSITVQEDNQLGLTGFGTLSSTTSGLDYTIYTWDLNITDLNTAFSFSQSQGPAPVPEPATMLLLGAGLAGLGVFRKKFRES